MKKIGILAAVMAMAFLCAGVASAEMYVEGYIGAAGAFNNLGQSVSIHDVAAGNGVFVNSHVKTSGVPDATVIGGLKLGTWFVKEGTLGWSGYPEWAKYFGFYTDFSYHNLVLREQRLGGTIFVRNAFGNLLTTNVGGQFSAEGSVADLAFMFAARYGFFGDSEVPFGRLQPYIAVGPAILFTSLKPKVNVTAINSGLAGATVPPGSTARLGYNPGNQSATSIALQAEGGVRFYALKNVSFDISVKYAGLANPEFKYSGTQTLTTTTAAGVTTIQTSNPATMKLNPALDLFSVQAGVAYHF
jgi:hypothetical protein